MKKARGITLVALVVTIIVMLILAGVSLNTIGGDNGLIARAFDAQLIAKFSGYNEELMMNCVEDTEVCAVKAKMKDYVPSLEDEYLDKFVIVKSKLLYIGTDEREIEIANRLGMGGGTEASDAEATVKEIQAIVDGVVALKDKFGDQLPTNDTDKLNTAENTNSNNGIIGTRLFDRSSLNLTSGTWNIMVEYNIENKETARYGTGCYWLKKNNNYIIGEETLNFKNDYIINYANKEFVVLSGRAVNWNEKATLGVPDNIALNLDPMSLANGEWKENNDINDIDEINNKKFEDFIVKNTDNTEINTGIQKGGDVVYNNDNKALEFNESDSNSTGEGGYLRLSKSGLDFSNGFTFEIYANLSRMTYDNTKNSTNNLQASGLFCKAPSALKTLYSSIMRFGFCQDSTICKFFEPSSWYGSGEKLSTASSGAVYSKDPGYKVNEDFYLTYVYRDFKEEIDDPFYDDTMTKNKVDKIECYINGKMFGYSYYGSDSYDYGRATWDVDDSKFFIGVCPWYGTGNLYYLKGSVYANRLYTSSLTPDQVKLNYDKTLKYRDSFKDE